jgi:ABC-type sugar transport system permease subunit
MTGRKPYTWWAPYFFIAPFVLLFAVFTVYPLIQSVWLAFHQTFGSTQRYVGLFNFRWLIFNDPDFRTAVWNTLVYAVCSVCIQLPCALALALYLNRPDVKARGFWRMIFFAPVLVGLAFVAIIFALLFEKNQGLVNSALTTFTGGWWNPEFPWLQDYVMPALVIATFWMYLGFNMVYFLAALQNVSKDLVEAAMVDGANPWQRFLHVTLPAIRPVATFVVLLSIIGSVQLFELPFLLLDGAGPDKQGLTVVMYLYQQGFDVQDLGFASAIGWLIAVVLFGIALIQKKLSGTGTS